MYPIEGHHQTIFAGTTLLVIDPNYRLMSCLSDSVANRPKTDKFTILSIVEPSAGEYSSPRYRRITGFHDALIHVESSMKVCLSKALQTTLPSFSVSCILILRLVVAPFS